MVAWVTKSLAVGDWTAIREIAVDYDAALVVTTNRTTPQSAPTADSFTIWTASLTDHTYAPLIRGVNLRWLPPEAPGERRLAQELKMMTRAHLDVFVIEERATRKNNVTVPLDRVVPRVMPTMAPRA